MSGMEIHYITRCNGSVLITESYINASGCEAGPSSKRFEQSTTVGQCIQMFGSRGISSFITCNRTSATVSSWSSSPLAPRAVRCEGAPAPARAAALRARCAVNPRESGEVSFEVSLPGGHVFLTVTALVGTDGAAEAALPGLRPGTQYRVAARAHRRGENEGNPDTWSGVSGKSALCTTPAEGVQGGRPARPVEGSGRPRAPRTRWLEAYRLVGGYIPSGQGKQQLLPDFLDQHNAADLPGVMGMVSLYVKAPGAFPLTRYCVEVQDVELPGVITASVDGKRRTAPFADFVSCNHGKCLCMHQTDRAIAHMPADQILDMCLGNPPVDYLNDTCRCSEPSMEQSNRYVGRSPIPLPFTVPLGISVRPSLLRGPGYPPASRPEHTGAFLSFPAGGRCPLGARVEEGNCTWQLSPVAHTVYMDDLVRMGFNVSSSTVRSLVNETSGEETFMQIDYDATMRNLGVAERAFADLRPPPCGEPAVSGDLSAATTIVV